VSDHHSDLNTFMDFIAGQRGVVATALAGDPSLILVVTQGEGNFADADAWAVACGLTIEQAVVHGSMVARNVRIMDSEITILLATAEALSSAERSAEISRIIGAGLFEIHDPQGIVKRLTDESGATFAENARISSYGDVSSDFFRLVGLGDAVFISDASTLIDWCEASGLSLHYTNARIHEIYGVDVRDLKGGLLIDIFERIRTGDYYKAWRAERDA
jgi:hypothetical protein